MSAPTLLWRTVQGLEAVLRGLGLAGAAKQDVGADARP
ncbi:MAG: hypothetical protein RLZZ352_670 [Pseudomonadota bacterium]|jgi:hypothetical protein